MYILTHPKNSLIDKNLVLFFSAEHQLSDINPKRNNNIFHTAEKYASIIFACYDVITRKNANLYVLTGWVAYT